MTQITAQDWLFVWERVRAGRSLAVHLSPRAQLRAFQKHVGQIESSAMDLSERLYCSAVWVGADRPRSEAVPWIQDTIRQLDIESGNSRPFCLAAIGGDLKLLRAVNALNDAKARFRRFCLESDSQLLLLQRDSRRWRKHVYPLQAELSGRPNFDYLLAYQQLPILAGLPEAITFRQEVARRTNRINREILLAKLRRKSGDAAARDIDRVQSTSSTEVEFAIDGPVRLANAIYVRFDGVDVYGKEGRTIRTNMPVFFRLGRRTPSLSFSTTMDMRTHKMRRRPTVAIRKERFLETMSVRRYLERPSMSTAEVELPDAL